MALRGWEEDGVATQLRVPATHLVFVLYLRHRAQNMATGRSLNILVRLGRSAFHHRSWPRNPNTNRMTIEGRTLIAERRRSAVSFDLLTSPSVLKAATPLQFLTFFIIVARLQLKSD